MVFKKLFVHMYWLRTPGQCAVFAFAFILGIFPHVYLCIDLFSVFLVFNFYLHLSSNKCTDCSYSVCFRKEWRRDLHLKPCAGYK